MSLVRDKGFVMTLETLRERRAEVLEVARRRGAKAVWAFGSVARGEATPASDIDFLVEFESGRSLLDQVHLIDELRSLLGTPVEVVATGGLLERDNHILIDFDAWIEDEDLRLITEPLVEIIGEAARAMTPEGRAAWPAVDWTGLVGLRNVLVNAYHRIQPELLWQAATSTSQPSPPNSVANSGNQQDRRGRARVRGSRREGLQKMR